MNKNIFIKDNLIEIQHFLSLKKLLCSSDFPWFYFPHQTSEVLNDSSYFFHNFYYTKQKNNSNYLNYIEPIIDFLNPHSLISIRANLIIKRKETNCKYHVDSLGSKKMSHKTAVFYVNTNNGYTKFKKNNVKVDCIENRIVIFPSNLEHKAVGQTDQDQRIVININFY
jgi:hypothetical protein